MEVWFTTREAKSAGSSSGGSGNRKKKLEYEERMLLNQKNGGGAMELNACDLRKIPRYSTNLLPLFS